jgi:hypothetical protein
MGEIRNPKEEKREGAKRRRTRRKSGLAAALADNGTLQLFFLRVLRLFVASRCDF